MLQALLVPRLPNFHLRPDLVRPASCCWEGRHLHSAWIICQLHVNFMSCRNTNFNHETGRIPPIIENLRSKDVASNTPHRLITLLRKPSSNVRILFHGTCWADLLVSEKLSVEIVHFKWAVVDMRGRICAHEECVVVYVILIAIDVREKSNVFLLSIFSLYI